MKFLLVLLAGALLAPASHAEPLRVFIRGGKKTHGPNAHEHARFLQEWMVLLETRGLKTSGALEFPTAEQLAAADVLVMYAQDAGNLLPAQRPALETFLQRGGGLVVIHTAVVATRPETSAYWKATLGGAWVQGKAKWKEGPMELLYPQISAPQLAHPITRGAVSFTMDDEMYYDLELTPDIQVLASALPPGSTTPQPQIWTCEKVAAGAPAGAPPYRVVVSIPGHLYSTFERPNYRAILLRSLAWAGRRPNVDEFLHARGNCGSRAPRSRRPTLTGVGLGSRQDAETPRKGSNFPWRLCALAGVICFSSAGQA